MKFYTKETETKRMRSRSLLKMRRGFTLLFTLAAIALISVLVLAFLSRSLMSRQVVFSSVGMAKAEGLTQSALDSILDNIIGEIKVGSDPVLAPGNIDTGYLKPKADKYMLPVPTATVPPTVLPTGLVKVSRSNVPFWPSDPNLVPAISPGPVWVYPGHSTGVPPLFGAAMRGRYWDAPYLTPRQIFSNGTVPNPDWVLLSRQGPIGPHNQPLDMTLFKDKTVTNSKYVIGRFAYTVYEVGGRLDINVAGNHSSVASNLAGKSLRTTQAMADLKEIFLDSSGNKVGSNANRQVWADLLVKWRNQQNFDRTDFETFQKEGVTLGLLNPLPGDQTFINRQDLIDFWIKNVSPERSGLAYLTTFSRGLNQPSIYPPRAAPLPLSIFNEALPADVLKYNHNAPFLFILVTSAFTRADGSTAKIGEPLVLRKFPLSHIKTHVEDVSGAVVTGSMTHKLFGLTRAGANQPWDYDPALLVMSPPITTGAPSFFRLKTLAEVRDENREPNFFELLQAAILSGTSGPNNNIATGSLGSYLAFGGTGGGNPNTRNLVFEDGVLGRQVLQIGANIIDQYDVDGYPTQIYVQNNPFYDVYGIEDLPYLQAVYQLIYRFAVQRTFPSVPEAQPAKMGFYFLPMLWNPHRQNPAASTTAPRPTEFRFRADSLSSVKGGDGDAYVDLNRPYPPLHIAYARRRALAGSGTSALSRLAIYNGGLNNADYGNQNLYRPFRAPDKGWIGGTLNPTAGLEGTENLFFQFDPFTAKFRTPDHLAGQLIPDTEIQTNFAECDVQDKNESNNIPTRFYALNYAIIPDVLTNIPFMQRSDGQTIRASPTRPGSTPQASLELMRDYPNAGGFGPTETTFTLDFKDAGGTWRPYSKIRRVGGRNLDQSHVQRFNAFGSGSATFYRGNLDPRTDRFGAIFDAFAWNNFKRTFRQTPATDAGQGSGFNFVPSLGASPIQNLTRFVPLTGTPFYGMLSQNRVFPPTLYTGANVAQTYITDPDGVTRGGDSFRAGTGGNAAGYVMGSSASLATNPAQPVVLNRPFESVAEMGYAFRGQPWKSVDFFTSTSADLALLDVFSVYDAPLLVGGQLNVNTVEAPVLKAILSGIRPDPVAATAGLSADDVKNIANRLVARRDNTSIAERDPLADLPGPYMDAVNFFSNPSLIENWAVNNVKIHSEAVVRSLADYSQSRVWNLMIDLTVESGSYTQNSSKLSEFSVNGVNRVWVHLALDRFTGKVLEQRIEVVTDTPL